MIENVYYISPRDVRKNRSDAVHIMMCCQALAEKNIKVKLVTPTIVRSEYEIKFEDINALYNIKTKFEIIELPTNIIEKDAIKDTFINMSFQKLLHFTKFYYSNRKNFRSKETVILSQCFISSVPYIFLKKLGLVSSRLTFMAAAIKKNSRLHKFVYKNSDIVVTGLKYTAADIIKYTGTDAKKFTPTPLIFLSNSSIPNEDLAKEECRKIAGFSFDKKYIIYAGKTGEGIKSVDYFIECAKRLPQFNFVIVGANNEAFKSYNERITNESILNLEIKPFMPFKDYNHFVRAADLLVDYYSATYYNTYYLGPGKSASYFSSKNPVIFSDLPSLRHLFPEEIVYFVKPDNISILVGKIIYVLANKAEADDKAERAFQYARKHSFQYTMGRIVDFIQQN
ncbi:MAG: hypothetical protein AB7O73_03720 [Bacteroidia bacterium]